LDKVISKGVVVIDDENHAVILAGEQECGQSYQLRSKHVTITGGRLKDERKTTDFVLNS
jgi:hypothetical protein